MKSAFSTRSLSRVLAGLLTVLCAASARATPPALIDYQGTVLDASNQPLANLEARNYTMYFRLYDQQTGGTLLWSEAQTVTVFQGQFSVQLGQGVAIAEDGILDRRPLNEQFDGTNRFLGLTVVVPEQASGEISPRLQFLTSPYAFAALRADTAASADVATRVEQTTGISALGVTNVTGNLSLNGTGSRLRVADNNLIEFGAGVVGKDAAAGGIGYGTYTPGALDVVGAGTTDLNRRIKFWTEGGAEFTGPGTFAGNLNLGASLTFSNQRLGQHVNLWGTNYGIGISDSTFYNRTGHRFSWYFGGSHVSAEDDPGPSGQRLMSLSRTNGLEIRATKVQGVTPGITAGLDFGTTPGIELRHQLAAVTGTDRVGYIDFSDATGGDFDVRLAMGRRVNNTVFAAFDRGPRNTRVDFFLNGVPITSDASCDITLKDDIRPLAGSLERVLALQPVDFTWRRAEYPDRHFPEGRSIGFIAQHVQDLVPEAVGLDQFGKLTMNFDRIVPHVVGAVQTQQAEIKRLERENADLSARVARLEAVVAALAEQAGLSPE